MEEAIAHYKTTHTAVRDIGEDLGENAAELHAIQDHYQGARRLDDGSRGRHRFDQIWQKGDRFIVVEAKASLKTELGKRRIGNVDYRQGTREYFDAIILKMMDRGEIELAESLTNALADGRLDYVAVRANPVGDKYHGYLMEYFKFNREK